MLIDTHCHSSLSWFEPIEVLLFQMERNCVDHSVLVQHRGEYDNNYLLSCARNYPGKFAVMGMVDEQDPDAARVLKLWNSAGMDGIRIFAPGHPGVPDQSPLWYQASSLGMPITTPSTGSVLAGVTARKVIEQLGNTPVILEHFGLLRVPEDQWEKSFQSLLSLSDNTNVYVKLHGFGEFNARPFPAQNPSFNLSSVPNYIDRVAAAFGHERLMIATDYPPSSSREGYANVIGLLRTYLSSWNGEQQEAILGGNASQIFGFQATS